MFTSRRLTALSLPIVALAAWAGFQPAGAASGPATVQIVSLNCTAPEALTIKNFGDTAVSLTGFRIQSQTPSGTGQDVALTDEVASIAANQTITFLTGTSAADSPATNTYTISGADWYRDTGDLDHARLVRSDASVQQVDCFTTPNTPTPTPTATPTTPAATATTPAATATATPTRTATAAPSVSASPTSTTSVTAPLPPDTGAGTTTADSPAWPLLAGGALAAIGLTGILLRRRR